MSNNGNGETETPPVEHGVKLPLEIPEMQFE
jgi:hypothetical protein